MLRKGIVAFVVLMLAVVLLVVGSLALAAAKAETVYWGSRGDTVRQVQTKLKQWGYYTGNVDGIFGQTTYDAVVWFQRVNGLTADGTVGTATLAALGIAGESASSSVSASLSDSDLTLLAHCIHGEARGEPYIGKVAVAAVVLNRVRSPSFPNTISGVIYQKDAFTCVNDGQLYLTPDEDAYRAARDALNGWDPTYGCLYYYNPSTAVSAWIWTREVRLTIGRHAFAI